MYGRWTGLLAAAFTTFAVIHIQHAHFYRPEPFTVLASLASLWAMLRFSGHRARPGRRPAGRAGGPGHGAQGIGGAHPGAAGLDLPVGLQRPGRRAVVGFEGYGGGALPSPALLAGLAALAVFFITTPYALLDVSAFIADIRAQAEMAREAGHWPFTWQYADTPAFTYQIRQTAVWGLGLPLGIVAWLAVPVTAWLAWRGGVTRRADLLLLAWVVPAFIFLELFEVKFLRYVFPLMPFCILMAARMLTAAIAWAKAQRRRNDCAARRKNPTTLPFPKSGTPRRPPWATTWCSTNRFIRRRTLPRRALLRGMARHAAAGRNGPVAANAQRGNPVATRSSSLTQPLRLPRQRHHAGHRSGRNRSLRPGFRRNLWPAAHRRNGQPVD